MNKLKKKDTEQLLALSNEFTAKFKVKTKHFMSLVQMYIEGRQTEMIDLLSNYEIISQDPQAVDRFLMMMSQLNQSLTQHPIFMRVKILKAALCRGYPKCQLIIKYKKMENQDVQLEYELKKNGLKPFPKDAENVQSLQSHGENPRKKYIDSYFKRLTTQRQNDANIFGLMVDQDKAKIETYCFIVILDKSFDICISTKNQKKILLDQENQSITLMLVQRTQLDQVSISFSSRGNPTINKNRVYLREYAQTQKEKRLFLISFTEDPQDLDRLRSDIWSSVNQILEIYHQKNQKESLVLTYLSELVNFYPKFDECKKDSSQHKFWRHNKHFFVKDEYYFTLFWFSIYKNTADSVLFKLNAFSSLPLKPNKKIYHGKNSANHKLFTEWKQFRDNIDFYCNQSTQIPFSQLLNQNSNNLMDFIFIIIERKFVQLPFCLQLILKRLEQNVNISSIQHYVLIIRYLQNYLNQYDSQSRMETIIMCMISLAVKIEIRSNIYDLIEKEHADTYNLPRNTQRLEQILLSNSNFNSYINPNLPSIVTLYQLYKTSFTKNQYIRKSFSKMYTAMLRLFQWQIAKSPSQVMKVLLIQPVSPQENALIERFISKNNFNNKIIPQIYLLFNYQIDFDKIFWIIQKIASKRKSFLHIFDSILMLNQLKVSPDKLMKITERIVNLIKIETISEDFNHITSIPRLLQLSILVLEENCRQLIILRIAEGVIKLTGKQRAFDILCRGLSQSTGLQQEKQRESVYQLLALPLFGEKLNKQIIFKALLSQPKKILSLQKSNQLIFNKLFQEIVEDIMDLKLTEHEMSLLTDNLPQIQLVKFQKYNLYEILNTNYENIRTFKQRIQQLLTLFRQYSCFENQIGQINIILEKFHENILKQAMELPQETESIYKEIEKIMLLKQTHYWKKQKEISSLQKLKSCFEQGLTTLKRKIDEIEFGDVSISIFKENFLTYEKMEQLLSLLEIKKLTLSKIQEIIHILRPKSLEMLERSFQVYLYINKLILPENDDNQIIVKVVKNIKDCINEGQRISADSQRKIIKKNITTLCKYYSIETTEDIQQLQQLLNKSKIYQTFDALEKCSDLKKLIDQEKIDQKLMEQLQEYVEDLQSSQISISNLNEFLKVFNFYSFIQAGHQSMENLKIQIKNHQERPHLSACILSCHSLIGQFKKLIWKAKNREISFKVQIQSMLNYGKLCFETSNNKVRLQIILNEQDYEKHMSWKELTNYKEKSMLIIKDMKKTDNRSSGTQQTLRIFEQFEKVYKKIERLLSCKQKLCQTGYNPDKLKTQILIIRGCTDSLDKELIFYEQNKKLWEQSIKEIYSQSQLLTYFIGPEVNYLKKAILEGTYLPLYHRVFNIQKKIFQRLIKFDNIYAETLQKLKKQLDPIRQFKLLSQVCSNLVQKDKFSSEISRQNKLTIIVCNAKYFYSCLLYQDRYANITQVLMCQDTTTLMELQCFFYRAFMDFNKRYFIIASHNLNEETKSAFVDLLLLFHIQKSVQLKSAKITFVTDKTNDKVIGLLTKNNLFDYEKKDMTEKMCELQTKQMLKFIKPTHIVKSARAGLGKTFKIQRLAKENKMKLIYFPICGNINSQNLSARLQKILADNEEFSLLIQVGHVQNKTQLQVFLSQIILFRSFYYQRYIFLPENTHVFVQIENIYCQEQQNSGYHIIRILQEDKQGNFCQNLLFFKQQQVVFDQQNRKDVFVLNYLHMIDNGQISKVDLPFCKQKQLQYPSSQQCRNLVKKYFSDWLRERKSEPTFLIYRNFMNMLFTIFHAFGDSPFFSLSLMEESPQQYNLLRLNEVRSNFLKVCIENTLQFLEESLNTNNFINHNFESKIRFQEKIKGHKLLIVPSYDLSSFQFVYFDDKNVPFVIKSLLIKENYDLNKRSRSILDSSKVDEIFKKTALNNFEGQKMTLKIFEILSHITGNRDFDPNNGQDEKAIKEIQTKISNLHHYKITLDNFFKMCLIILRSLSRIPIIIMGESGVGKTSLIKFLVETVYKQKLIVKNVHAGIHEKQIKIWIEEITDQASFNPQNIWVFFDEFNTSDELSYFKEIIVDRRFMGKSLPQNIIFLAACNPYRERKANKVNVGLAYMQKHRQAKVLAFNVKPPCLSMIQLMWDYEQLKKQELQQYIRSMIRDVDFSKHSFLVTAIVEIHQYFKHQREISSVSLRDVCRFKELYFWFLIHMPHNEIHHSKRKTKKLQIDPNEIAVILSFCFCYSLGIESRQRRQEILEKAQKRLDFNKGHMTRVLEQIQIEYIKKLSIEKEKVAFNSALMENLFASLVCLNNRIPILIIGSPGSSKSLSVRMIESSLKGKSSSSLFCQSFPKVNMLYFQGSQSSTSEGVEYLYAKAYEKMKKEKQYNIKNGCANEQQLHCILFDQIGLAQKSIHNPLKVLHSKLQTDQKQLGFIGISNYQLDSAKMSRFLVLAHANPGEKQLKETAKKIYEGFFPQQDKYKRQFQQLGQHYSQFIKKWNQNPANITNFFGLRDFYSCLKYICQYISKKGHQSRNSFEDIVQKAVTANFDGQNGSLRLFFQIMKRDKQFMPVNPIDLVKQSLSSTQSRCLMLIIKSDALIPIINESIEINGSKIDVVCLYGSTFDQDKQSEQYNLQTTSQIITHLSRPVILTFKDINNSIQTSLYDLFNKSFVNRKNSRTCRIAVGANSNPKCQVHADFNSIIYVQQEMVSKLDLPFINRFQKHQLNIKSMIKTNDLDLLANIMEWIQKVLSVKDSLLVLKRQNYILNCSDEAIVTLILKLKGSNDMEKDIKSQLLRNRTIDFDILMKDNPEVAQANEINKYLNHVPWTSNHNDLIIFTYDQFPNLQKSSMQELYVIKMGEIKNEKILKKYLSEGLKYDKMHIILNYQTEREHLNYLLFKAKQMKLFMESKTQMVIIVKLYRFFFIRNKIDTINISYLHNYDQYFVEDLSSTQYLSILECKTVWQAFQFFNVRQKIQGLQFDALKLIKLTVQQGQNPNISKEVFHAISQLPRNAKYRQKLLQIIESCLSQQNMNLQFLHKNKKNAHYSINLLGAVEQYVIEEAKSIIFDLQCTIISEGVVFNGDYLYQSLQQSHCIYLNKIFDRNLQQLLKIVHQQRFQTVLNNFRLKMNNFQHKPKNNAIRQMKNPLFLSLFPQSYLDFSTIFSLKPNSDQTIESIFKNIGLFVNNQQKAKLVKTSEKQAELLLNRAKFNFAEQICPDGYSQKIMEDLYFYDTIMFLISKHTLQIQSSKKVDVFNFFLELFSQFTIQKKIFLLVYDTHLVQHIIGLLSIIFEKTANFVQDFKQLIVEQSVNDYLVRLTQLLIKKSCEVIQFNPENMKNHKNAHQFVSYFQNMFERIRALQLDYKQINNFQAPLLIYSLNSLIQLQFNLKKRNADFQNINFLKRLDETSTKGSLFQKICKIIKDILQMNNLDPNCEDLIINYLSLSLFSDWLDSIADYPSEKNHCAEEFMILCNKYSRFANSSSYYFISLFKFLDEQSLGQMRESLQQKDEDDEFQIKKQWISLRDNFSVALGNYFNTLITGQICEKYLKEDQIVNNSQLLKENANVLQELCNKREWLPTLQSIYQIELMKKLGQAYIQILIREEDLATIDRFDDAFSLDTQPSSHLRVYLLKMLLQVYSFEEIEEKYIKVEKCKWISQMKEYIVQQKVQYFLPPQMITEGQMTNRQNNLQKRLIDYEKSNFENIVLYHEILNEVLNDSFQPAICYQVLTFFLMKIYNRGIFSRHKSQKLYNELRQRGDVHQPRNILVFDLLRRYISGQITKEVSYDANNYKQQIMELNYLNMFVSWRRLRVPMMEMFFNDGRLIDQYGKWLNDRFLLGSIHSPTVQRLQFILRQHKKSMIAKSYSICSATCDYLSPIGGVFYGKDQGCPHPTSQAICPLCNGKLGAEKYNKLINEQNGARIIQPERVENEMERIRSRYHLDIIFRDRKMTLLLKGYHNGTKQRQIEQNLELRKTLSQSACDHMQQSTSLATHYIQCYLNNLIWYYLAQFDLIKDNQFEAIWMESKNTMRRQLKVNLQFYRHKLRQQLKLEEDEFIIWNMGIGKQLFQFLQSIDDKYFLKNSQDRDRFQDELQSKLCRFYDTEKDRLIQESRNVLQFNKGDIIRQTGDIRRHQNQFKYIRMFKIVKEKPGIQNLGEKYAAKLAKEYKILHQLITKDQVWQKLDDYKTIFTFLSLIQTMFDGRISRRDSQERLEKMVKDKEKYGELLQEFVDAWNRIASNKFELSLDCHSDKVLGCLPQITKQSPLKMFLFDMNTVNNQHAQRLIAFTIIAANDYNLTCRFFDNLLASTYPEFNQKSNFGKIRLNPTNLTSQHLMFGLNRQKLQEIIEGYSSQSVEYGISTSHYSFQKIQRLMVRQLIGRRYLQSEKQQFKFIHYIGEQVQFITELRNRSQQKTLDELGLKESVIKFIQKISKNKADVLLEIKDIQAGLEKIVIFFMNMKCSESAETIEHFVQKSNIEGICQQFKKQVLAKVPLLGLADLYELIEYYSFESVPQILDSAYDNELSKEEKSRIQEIRTAKRPSLPTWNEFKWAMYKFAGRGLCIAMYKEDQKLQDHLCSVLDYWPKGIAEEKIGEDLKKLLSPFTLAKVGGILRQVPFVQVKQLKEVKEKKQKISLTVKQTKNKKIK